MNKTIIIITVFILSCFTGCSSDFYVEKYYLYPDWRDSSNTVYCLEAYYEYEIISGFKQILMPWTNEISIKREESLVLMDTNGENISKVVLLTDELDYLPQIYALSLSTNSIVYDTGEIYIMDYSGNNKRKLVSHGGDHPEISPDGTKVAYVWWAGSPQVEALNIVNTDGTNDYEVYRETGTIVNFTWSPDSSKIAIPDSNGTIIINITSLESTVIGESYWHDLAWSPDDTKFVYCKSSEMWTINTDGSNDQFLSEKYIQNPRWSPDGTKIIGGHDVRIMNSDGTGYKVIANYSDEIIENPN